MAICAINQHTKAGVGLQLPSVSQVTVQAAILALLTQPLTLNYLSSWASIPALISPHNAAVLAMLPFFCLSLLVSTSGSPNLFSPFKARYRCWPHSLNYFVSALYPSRCPWLFSTSYLQYKLSLPFNNTLERSYHWYSQLNFVFSFIGITHLLLFFL